MTGSANRRLFCAYVGAQGTGKTYQLGERILDLRSDEAVTSVFVLDRLREFSEPTARPVSSRAEYLRMIEKCDGTIPRAVSFQLGLENDDYQWVLDEAIELGDVAIVIDEAYSFLPSGQPIKEPWKSIVFAGRHLDTADGRSRPCHLVLATQYPRTVHAEVWSQANEVWCSRLVGDRARFWIRDYYGTDEADAVAELAPREWRLIFEA